MNTPLGPLRRPLAAAAVILTMGAGHITGWADTPLPASTAGLRGDIGLAHRPVLQGLVDRADPAPVPWTDSNALVRQLGGHAGHWRGRIDSAADMPVAPLPASKEPAR